MRVRNLIASIACTVLLAGAVAAAGPAGAAAPAAKTPATGELDTSFSASAFTALQKAGLSLYSYENVRVGLGDDGGIGARWPVNAVDGFNVYADPEAGALVWINGAAGKRLDMNSLAFVTKDGKTGVLKAKVYANGDSLGTLTLFDVTGSKMKMTLHKGVDQTLDTALATKFFAPGMALGNLFVASEPVA